MDLADFLRPRLDRGDLLISAVVEDVKPDGTVNLSFLGGLAFSVPVLGWYVPSTGDVVRVLRVSPTEFLVIGTARVSNPATIRVVTSRTMSWAVDAPLAAPDPGDNPSGLVSPFVVSAEQSRSYRSGTGWERDDVYQGAHESATSVGYWTGCWFYGTKPQSAKGVRVRRARMEMRRAGAGGVSADEPLYLWPHAHATRPGGAPVVLTGSIGGVRPPVRVGTLAWAETATTSDGLAGFDLPVAWVQALVDGEDVRGFCLRENSTANYLFLDSKADFAASGRLTIAFD